MTFLGGTEVVATKPNTANGVSKYKVRHLVLKL
jgi:hypothetical protein